MRDIEFVNQLLREAAAMWAEEGHGSQAAFLAAADRAWQDGALNAAPGCGSRTPASALHLPPPSGQGEGV